MPDHIADSNITGHGKGDNNGDCQPEMDEKKVLEELCIRGDDTEVEHDLGPRCPPGIPLLEECEVVEQPVILCHRYIFRARGDMLSLRERIPGIPESILSPVPVPGERIERLFPGIL